MKAPIWKIIHRNSLGNVSKGNCTLCTGTFNFFLANKGFSGPLVVFHKRLSVTSNQLKAFVLICYEFRKKMLCSRIENKLLITSQASERETQGKVILL